MVRSSACYELCLVCYCNDESIQIKVAFLGIPILIASFASPGELLALHGINHRDNASASPLSSNRSISFLWREANIKTNCLAYWKRTGWYTYWNEQGHACDGPKREIEFTEKNYEEIYDLANRLKSNPGLPLTEQILNAKSLRSRCADKSALRVAKTARLWGTTDLKGSNDVLTDVVELRGSSDYKILLDACEKRESWLTVKETDLALRINLELKDIKKRHESDSVVCDIRKVASEKDLVNKSYTKKITKELHTLKHDKKFLRVVDELKSTGSIINQGGTSGINGNALKVVSRKIKACQKSFKLASEFQQENKRKARDRMRAEAQANARRLAEQRRLKAENEHRLRKKKAHEDAVESVVLD